MCCCLIDADPNKLAIATLSCIVSEMNYSLRMSKDVKTHPLEILDTLVLGLAWLRQQEKFLEFQQRFKEICNAFKTIAPNFIVQVFPPNQRWFQMTPELIECADIVDIFNRFVLRWVKVFEIFCILFSFKNQKFTTRKKLKTRNRGVGLFSVNKNHFDVVLFSCLCVVRVWKMCVLIFNQQTKVKLEMIAIQESRKLLETNRYAIKQSSPVTSLQLQFHESLRNRNNLPVLRNLNENKHQVWFCFFSSLPLCYECYEWVNEWKKISSHAQSFYKHHITEPALRVTVSSNLFPCFSRSLSRSFIFLWSMIFP